MIQWLKPVAGSLLDLLYPPLCLHCRELTRGEPLCTCCVEQLELVDPMERCRLCFDAGINPQQRICRSCLSLEPLFDEFSAAFEYAGPVSTLLSAFKQSGKFWLAEGLAGYMAAQFLRLDWPLPDLIVPVPLAWDRSLARGYNQSALLSEVLGGILNVSVKSPLRRRWGSVSQSSLSGEARLQMDPKSFFLKGSVYDKTILLIDDFRITGTTLRCAAEALLEGCPAKLYALSFASL